VVSRCPQHRQHEHSGYVTYALIYNANNLNHYYIGVTIDYGPFGFMEHFDPGFICNGSDNAYDSLSVYLIFLYTYFHSLSVYFIALYFILSYSRQANCLFVLTGEDTLMKLSRQFVNGIVKSSGKR